MAGEFKLDAPARTGDTLYTLLYDANGQIYDTVGANFEVPVDAQWTQYDTVMTEQGTASGFFIGTMPSVAAGVYLYSVRRQAGGSPAITDSVAGSGEIHWNGSAEVVLSDIVSDTNELQGDWADGGRLDLILDARASQTTADAIETDTQDIQSRLPAALVGGAMDSDVSNIQSGAIDADAIATDAIGAAELAADAVEEIADGVWDEDIEAAHGTDATSGLLLRALGQNISNRTHNANLYDSIREVISITEHQRASHTHQPIGDIFYVDPVNGGTHAGGNRGGISDPYDSVQDCHDNAITDSNHDMIILLSGAAAGATTLTEDVTLSKRYLFIRGPGRDFVWTRSGSGDTIDITADGIELSGFQLNTAATGSGNGITVTSADFFKVHRLWINDTQGNAINITDCDNYVIDFCRLQGSGQSGSGDGISINAGNGESCNYGIIRECSIGDVQGDGILLNTSGSGIIDALRIQGNTIQGCTDDGIDLVNSGANDTIISDNTFGNNTNDIEDAGTNTVLMNNEQWAKAGTTADDLDDLPTNATIADAVWDEAVAGHVGAGSFGATDAAILADTNELQGDWVDGGRLDLILDARSSQTTADAIETDTQDIQSRLPSALVSGRMDSDVAVIQANAVTASALATDAVNEISDGVWDEAKSGHTASGSFGEEVQDHALSSEISALNDISVADIWNALTSGLSTASSIGKLLVDNINATISSRSSHGASDVRAEMDANSTKMEAIRTDTDELQTDWTNAGRLDTILDTINSDTDDIQTRLPAALVSGRMDSDIGALQNDIITAASIAADAIDDAAIAADVDTYQAKVWLIDDNTGSEDRYFAVWFKNGQPVTSGITSPTIQVIKAADGADLVASTAMTEVGSLGLYRYDETTAANRISAGRAYFVKVESTIDSSTRTWFTPLGRDS